MEVRSFEIEGLKLICPKVFEDERGSFFESFNQVKYKKAIGKKINFIQDNESHSVKGVLRGLHLQRPPFAQAKLVRVIKGEVQDVAVDLRPDSESFGQFQTVILSASNKHQFYIPRGFAHGFLVLSDEAIFSYKVDNHYSMAHETGLLYNDEDLRIPWMMDDKEIILSEKDIELPTFQDYKQNFY